MIANKLQRTLIEFTETLNSWIVGEENTLIDIFEAEYSENYAPGNATVIYAGVYNYTKDIYYLQKCYDMIKRSIKLLENKQSVSPFCRVFLFHYTLMAIHYLPEIEKNYIKNEFGNFFKNYEDDCRQVNINCAALQWGNEIFLSNLRYKKLDKEKVNQLLQNISNAQNFKGFINDSISENNEQKDGMPIAYHIFILSILINVIVATSDNSEFSNEFDLAKKILKQGINWLSHTYSSDLTFAMAERSSYQMFTWGSLVTIICYSNLFEDTLVNKVLHNWLKYKKSDGSYSCTPNYLPHELRTGFETYTHVNMYNTLALVNLVTAERILSKNLKFPCDTTCQKNNHFVDYDSGYAFYRREGDFFGCSLRLHDMKYIPALQGFHFRIKGKETPIAEPKLLKNNDLLNTFLMNSLFEGYILKDSEGKLYYSDSTKNATIKELEYGFEFSYDDEVISCRKKIQIIDNKIEWEYNLTPKRDFIKCEHVLPIIVYDGRNSLKSKILSNKTINVHFNNSQYQISCNNARKITVSVEEPRNLLSVSGVSTLIKIYITNSLQTNKSIQWKTSLTYINDVPKEATYEEKLNAENMELRILKLKSNKQGKQRRGTTITYTVEAVGKELSYAWYVYKDNERIHVEWYSNNYYFMWTPNEPGVYRILVFVKDFEDNKVTKYSDEIIIL